MPTVLDHCHGHLAPCNFSKVHVLKLVYLVDKGRGYIVLILVNGSANKPAAVVCLEATNDASIVRLDMSSKVGCEVLDMGIC